jgi:hypothetical protein
VNSREAYRFVVREDEPAVAAAGAVGRGFVAVVIDRNLRPVGTLRGSSSAAASPTSDARRVASRRDGGGGGGGRAEGTGTEAIALATAAAASIAGEQSIAGGTGVAEVPSSDDPSSPCWTCRRLRSKPKQRSESQKRKRLGRRRRRKSSWAAAWARGWWSRRIRSGPSREAHEGTWRAKPGAGTETMYRNFEL